MRDKMNSAKYKRPNFRMPWPFIDLWHLIKSVNLFSPWVYILAIYALPSLIPENPWSWVVGAALAKVAWRITPVPKHWRQKRA